MYQNNGVTDSVLRCAVLAGDLAATSERERSLPRELVDALIDSGLPRAGVPRLLGGPELPPSDALHATGTVARADASAGWCAAIASATSLLSAYLPARGAAEVFGDPRAVAAGVWAPTATARPVTGGVQVTGRWAFASGVPHADWLLAGCLLVDPAAPEDAAPLPRFVAVPVRELKVEDTWHTSGLRGTGSHDVVAADVFVPGHRTASLVDGPPPGAGPLHRFPLLGYFAQAVAAAALGNARGAMDDLVRLAAAHHPSGGARKLGERPAVQTAVARAEAALRAARLLCADAVADAWQTVREDREVSLDARVALRLAASHAVTTAAEVVSSLYDLGGAMAVYERSPLQRRFRDARTITAHVQVNSDSYEPPGRHLLGLPISTDRL
ncbi:acyl-CoA dehydrogenase family protein [Streptomyces tendae]